MIHCTLLEDIFESSFKLGQIDFNCWDLGLSEEKEWSSLNTFEFQTNCIQWMQIHGDDDDVVTQTLAK